MGIFLRHGMFMCSLMSWLWATGARGAANSGVSGADGVLRFVSANEKAETKNKVEDGGSKKLSATRQEIRRQWSELQKQIHEPGKMHKMKRMALAQFQCIRNTLMREQASMRTYCNLWILERRR